MEITFNSNFTWKQYLALMFFALRIYFIAIIGIFLYCTFIALLEKSQDLSITYIVGYILILSVLSLFAYSKKTYSPETTTWTLREHEVSKKTLACEVRLKLEGIYTVVETKHFFLVYIAPMQYWAINKKSMTTSLIFQVKEYFKSNENLYITKRKLKTT